MHAARREGREGWEGWEGGAAYASSFLKRFWMDTS
ncbi:hypothetical protein OI25_309 [Paraburkholderia fungorum]|uniref:Uncharacterized protein n=1 Tax=Paraburkholderia fungorum TaxID=134537 RepID=A0AAU8T0Q9_9BURK|nr:hypothetical protein OI25_309 [Paraburkholderia fungorum]